VDQRPLHLQDLQGPQALHHLQSLLLALPQVGANMTLHRTHASLAMDRRVHAAMTTPTSTSASKPRSQLAVAQPQAHQVHQALQPLGASTTLRRTRVSLAMEWRAPVETLIHPSISAWRPRSQLAVTQPQAQAPPPLGASMTLHRTRASPAMEWRAPAETLIHPSISVWHPRSQHVEALQLLVVAVTVPQIVHKTPAADALPCRSLNAATPSLACISAGDCQISAAMQTQPLLSLSKMARCRSLVDRHEML